MSTLTAADLQAITGASGDNIEAYIARLSKAGLLSTEYEKAVRGKARKFSRENARELGVIVHLVKQGLKPAEAAKIAAHLLEVMKTKKPKGFLTVFPDGHYTISDKPPGPTIQKYMSCVCVNIGQLEREIDEYLEGQE